MTLRRACLAALAATALLALALVPQAGAKKAAPHVAAKASSAKAASARKRARAVRQVRWRAATSAFRIGPGTLFGGSGPGGSTTAPGGGAPGVPAPGGGGSGGPTAPAPVYHTLSVASKEFSLTLSRELLTPGPETIQLNNRGEDPHNLVISPDDGSSGPVATYPDVASLDSHTQQVDLPAGSYKLWCSLPGHEALGMHATLRVE